MPPRSTRILSTARDDPDPHVLDEAARVLRAGGLVAFATETVYGLGADATDPAAVAGIFAAKGRPATNPLIVHADEAAMARECVATWPPSAERLAARWWPGPLTLVLPRSRLIPDLVTAGRDTVGIRVPRSAVALGLIRRLARPIAAPSANRSTGVSPTLARHVLRDLDGRIDLVLDSGPTEVGLESTVLDLAGAVPRLLRPGPIGLDELRTELGNEVEPPPQGPPAGPATSPGQMAIHYAPRTPAVRVEADRAGDVAWPPRFGLIDLGGRDLPGLPPPAARFTFTAPASAAAGLYAALHQLDELGLDRIVVIMPPDREEWRAIRDRLRRATRSG